MMKIPDTGAPTDWLFDTLEAYRADDTRWRDGRTFAYVFDAGAEVEAVVKRAFTMFLSENGLDPTAFPSARRLETEVVAMMASHLGGDDRTVGSFTSGGTESILCAVKCARDWARATRPEITRPAIALPETGHPAFHKAAHYLGVDVIATPVDPATFRADVDGMRAALTDQVILVVGSAVSYAHGVVDPIADIAALAAERGVLCHVDACMGGFMLPYFRRLGGDVPAFDLGVPGVSSLSVDLHKYGFAAKGASVVLYRDAALRQHQLFACARWPGYTLVNTTVQSSKSVGPMAAAWAVLHHIGDAGYLDIARALRDATAAIITGVEAIDGLRVLGRPDMNLVAFTSDAAGNGDGAGAGAGAGVFHIADEMTARGWHVQPQLGYGGSPANIHLSIGPSNVRWTDRLLADLRASVDAARDLAPNPLVAQLGPVVASLARPGAPALSPEMFHTLLGAAGIEGAALPERMAGINEILEALPPALREQLLSAFMGRLFSPPDDRGAGQDG